jgi:hypothetical protein
MRPMHVLWVPGPVGFPRSTSINSQVMRSRETFIARLQNAKRIDENSRLVGFIVSSEVVDIRTAWCSSTAISTPPQHFSTG